MKGIFLLGVNLVVSGSALASAEGAVSATPPVVVLHGADEPAIGGIGITQQEACVMIQQECLHRYDTAVLVPYLSSKCRGALPHAAAFMEKEAGLCRIAPGECAATFEAEVRKSLTANRASALAQCEREHGVKAAAEESELPAGGKAGQNPAARKPPTIPVQKAPEKKYFFDLSYRVLLSDENECRAKQEKWRSSLPKKTLGKGVDDPTLFCDRLFPGKPTREGGKGNMPLELSSKLDESRKAELRWAPVKVVLEFTSLEQCSSELSRLDILHGDIFAFFAPFSKSAGEICNAIIGGSLPSLWQFATGEKVKAVTGARR